MFSRYVLLLTLGVLLLPFTAPTAYASNSPGGPSFGRMAPPGHTLTRTFTPADAPFTRSAAPTESVAARAAVDFEMSYEAFLERYAVGRYLTFYQHFNYSGGFDADYVFPMDVKYPNLDTPGTWVMPDIPFEDTWHNRIADPADTPYGADYPEATHALVELVDPDVVDYDAWYEYYAVTPEGVRLVGYAVEGDMYEGGVLLQGEDWTLALFPLDETQDLYQEEIYFDADFGQEVKHWQRVNMHGYGTFQMGDEEMPAGVFIDDIVWQEPDETDPDEVLDFETFYTILGEDGTRFSFYVSPATADQTHLPYMGEIHITDAELWRLSDANPVDAEPTGASAEAFALEAAFPNPFAHEATIRYHMPAAGPARLTVYNVLGQEVAVLAEGVHAAGPHTATLSAAGLPAGVYIYRLAAEGRQEAGRVVLAH